MIDGEREEDPEVGLLPLHPPEARQLVALVEDHERDDELPAVIDEGERERDTDGGGEAGAFTVTVTDADDEPPEPVHDRE